MECGPIGLVGQNVPNRVASESVSDQEVVQIQLLKVTGNIVRVQDLKKNSV